MPTLCRDCATYNDWPGPCPACGGTRMVSHDELDDLALAHIDCDAFFAAVEKRDDPSLADKPVLVGGGRRGVVAACCYVARGYGIHSAMPMFQALKRCPDAVVIRPDKDKYGRVGREVRQLMLECTPLVEPISIDEAFLDLSGTEALHGGAPARTLVKLIRRIEDAIGIQASVGLSYNKFLAKVASDLDKPRGFAVIGRTEATAFLENKPVSMIWGVGKVLRNKLQRDGIAVIGQLRGVDEKVLMERYGSMGPRLARFSRGEDGRKVEPNQPAHSMSAETTLETDVSDPDALAKLLWPLSEKVARRLKRGRVAGTTVTLKLKTADFRSLTRARTLPDPTVLAERIYRTGLELLEREADGRRFRLIGIGAGNLTDIRFADPPDLLDGGVNKGAEVESAMDAVREKFGDGAILKGRGLKE